MKDPRKNTRAFALLLFSETLTERSSSVKTCFDRETTMNTLFLNSTDVKCVLNKLEFSSDGRKISYCLSNNTILQMVKTNAHIAY